MRTFSAFIHELEEELFDMVRVVEGLGWHHLPTESPEFLHYLRLLTWVEEVAARRQRYDYIKGGRQTRRSWRELQAFCKESNRVGGHPVLNNPDERSSGQPDALGRAVSEGGYGEDDTNQDDSAHLHTTERGVGG